MQHAAPATPCSAAAPGPIRLGRARPCPRASPPSFKRCAYCSATAVISQKPPVTAPPPPASPRSPPALAPRAWRPSWRTCTAACCGQWRWNACCSRARRVAAISRSWSRASRRSPTRPRRPPIRLASPPMVKRRNLPPTLGRRQRARPPRRLERSHAVYADLGGTRGAGAPAPVGPDHHRDLPRPRRGAGLLHGSILERVVRPGALLWRHSGDVDAGAVPARERVRKGAGQSAGASWRGGIRNGRRSARRWGFLSARRR